MRTATEILAEIERLEEMAPTQARMERLNFLNDCLDEMRIEAAMSDAGDPDDFRDLGGMGVEPR
jgi:hypothetical protein